MAKIHYNKQNQVDMPTLRIQNRNFDTLGNGTINKYVSGFTYKQYFNSANEASFKVYKKVDSVVNPIWDYILDCKILDIDEYTEKYEIKVTPLIDENGLYKNVTCTDLAVSELSQVHLYTIEINTTDDIARTDYDANFPTLFYRVPDISFYDWTDNKYANYTDAQKLAVIKGSSLLHRLLEKAYNYSIVYVDDSLANLKKIASFSIDDATIYDELTGEISDEYGVLFKFDSVNRTVSAYDLYNTCNTCGYRGDFSDVCPECGSTDFGGQYGNDTTICINDTNLATQIQRESDVDSLKNTFRVEGGDDNITAAIASVNPNGSNYIYYFSPDVMADMTEELVTGLNNYNALYAEYQTTHEYSLTSEGVTNYNSVINYIKTYFPDSEYMTISSPMTGYSATSTLLYDAIDVKAYVKTSMMPTITVDNLTIEETMALLVASNLSPIAITNPSTAVQSIADNAVLGMAKVLVNTALYTIEISESVYTSGTTGTWVGKFKLTSIEDSTVTLIGDEITLSVTSDVETYIKQKIDKLMAKSDIDEALDLSNMNMTLDTFKSRLHYYSIGYLQGLHTEFESVVSIILENKTTMDDLYSNFYSTYNNRVVAIDTEIVTRTTQLGYINAIYDEVESLRSTVKTALNLQSYLGADLWKTFCSYRREDKYSNSNYISDGLNNAEIITRATELFKAAQRELYKAGTMQYSMTTTMNNLLMIKEFKPFADDFEVGNWLNVQLDDVNYRLRLLSYEINFGSLEQINVEFSTVSKIWSGTSDVKSVIDSARSIAGSYSNTTQQVNKSAEATNKVNDWVKNSLSTTNVKIVNDTQNATFVQDKNGILAREYDELTETYEPTQTRFLPSGIYVTDDAWESVKTALGKYAYVDPLDGETKIAFGLIADTIVGRMILSEKTIITNGSNSVTIDGNGITLDGGAITWTSSAPINTVEVEYCLSDSATELLNNTEWSTKAPPWISGKYMWQRTTTTDASGHESQTTTCISGATGQTGATGTGISSTVITYQSSKSGTTVPTETWLPTIPSVSANQYLWTRTVITYTDNSTSTSYSVGKMGETGSAGADAYTVILSNESNTFVGNVSNAVAGSADTSVVAYKGTTSQSVTIVSVNGVAASTSSTATGITGLTFLCSALSGTSPTITFKCTTSFVSPSGAIPIVISVGGISITKYFSYSIAFKGATGQTGETGTDGTDGLSVTSVVMQYYLSTSPTALSGGSWSTTIPPWVTGSYIWTRAVTTLSDSSTQHSTAVYDTNLTTSKRFDLKVQTALTGSSTTEIGSDYVISPKIGGGYLHISNGAYNVQIDPNNAYTGTNAMPGYVFSVNNGTTPVMGVTATGRGYFKGEIHANGGYIGGTDGWAITEKLLYSTNGEIKLYKDSDSYIRIKNGGLQVKTYDESFYSGELQLAGYALYSYQETNKCQVYLDGDHMIFTDHVNAIGETGTQRVVIYNGTSGSATFNMRLSAWSFDLEFPADDNMMYSKKIISTDSNFNKFTIGSDYWNDIVIANNIIPRNDNVISIGDSAHHYTSVYAKNGTIQTSDRNKKTEIKAILPIYEELFMKTVTVQYLFEDGDRIHFGVISQCFEALMKDLGLKDTDCAAFCKDIHYIYDKDEDGMDIESTKHPELDKDGNIVYDYAFRYSEFIMLTVHMVQKTIKRVDTLEETVKTQQSNIEELQTTVKAQQDTITELQADKEKQAKLIQALCEKVGIDPTSI